MRQHLSEVAGEIKKLDTALNDESRYAKQVEHDSRHAFDLVTAQFASQKEQLLGHQQKLESTIKLISMEAQERESLALSVKQAFESSLSTLTEQNKTYVQSEVNKRVQLTQDIVAAFKKLRDEIAAGFQRSMDGQQEAETALKSVEAILRAEIRGRIQSNEAHAKHVTSIDHRTASDAQILVEGLRELDASLADTRRSLSDSYRPQLEQVAGRVYELQESLCGTNKAVRDMQAAVSDSASQARDATQSHLVNGQALRADVNRMLSQEVDTLREKLSVSDTHIAELRSDNKTLRDELDTLRSVVQRIEVQSEDAVGILSRELHETVTVASSERERLVVQMQKALENERDQWETVAKRLQDDATRRAKSDKEQFKRLKTDVRHLTEAKLGAHSPQQHTQDLMTRSAGDDLRNDVDELFDCVARLDLNRQAHPANSPPPVAPSRRRNVKYSELLSKPETANISQFVEALRSCEDRNDTQTKQIDAIEEELVSQLVRIEKEEQVRVQETHQLRAVVERLAVAAEVNHAAGYQTQIDELRGSAIAGVKATDKKVADVRTLLEHQVRGCSKAHSDHHRRCNEHDKDLAALDAQCKSMQEEIKSHAGFLDSLQGE